MTFSTGPIEFKKIESNSITAKIESSTNNQTNLENLGSANDQSIYAAEKPF